MHHQCGFRSVVTLSIGLMSCFSGLLAGDTEIQGWEQVFQVAPATSVNALADLGKGVIVVGTRGEDSAAGQVFSSHDFGENWEAYGRLIDTPIVSMLALDSKTVLAGTSTGDIWKSSDQGKSWHKIQQICDVPVYGLLITDQGTVLASNYDLENQGHVYRSTDRGETWSELAELSPQGLYRFQKVRDGIILNGRSGHVYKSIDDGLTWTDLGQVSTSPLHPIEALPRGVALMGNDEGAIYRSTDDGHTWKMVAKVNQPLDDFVWIHDDLVYVSAYQGLKQVFMSHDAGQSWSSSGALPDGEVLDHAILLQDSNPSIAIAGTTQGRILRFREPKLSSIKP